MYNEVLRKEKTPVITEDGSLTLYSKEFDQTYHSARDGALQESLQKHVLPAFKLRENKKKLNILDICFGLGYNTLTTLYYLKTQGLDTKVHILSPEFDRELVTSLATFRYPKVFAILQPVIEALSKNFYYEDEQCTIEILPGDARVSLPKITRKIDIVYQDAFSPKQNPMLWTREYFSDLRSICAEDAILTTYSVAIATRMGLYENGFEVYIHEGENFRKSTIASPEKLEGLTYVDMVLKKQRNPEAASLRDSDFIS